MPYVIATALACLATFAYERRPRWRLLMTLAALPLCLVAALRWNIGTDFRLTYLPEYKALEHVRGVGRPAAREKAFVRLAKKGIFGRTPQKVRRHFVKVLRRSEPGYRVLMEGALRSGIGFRGVVAFCATITTVCVFLAIFRQSRWPILAVFLYVFAGNYFLSLNIMRQYVAVGFWLLAVPCIRDRRPWRFLLCFVLGSLFHYSAVLLLPCYALSRVEIRPRTAFALVAVGVASSFAVAPFTQNVLQLIGWLEYAKYFHGSESRQGFEWMLFAINLCFLLMGAHYWERAKAGNGLFTIWYGMMAIGTVALALSGALPLMKRINVYFAAANFLVLPEMLLAEADVRRRRLLTILVVLAFVAETAVSVLIFNKNGVWPYRI